MSKAEKKFVIYATAAVFVLVAVLLAVINIVNFTMAARDADELTLAISQRNGSFGQWQPGEGRNPNENPFQEFGGEQGFPEAPGQFGPQDPQGPQDQAGQETPPELPEGFFRMGGFGPMGPDSPEMEASIRYFTVSLSSDGKNAKTEAFNISAVTEEEAVEWAKSLYKESTGWTHGTYRYRVYQNEGRTYVTVIDQARELLPSYRILIISAIGLVVAVALSFIFLKIMSKKLFEPLKEADRKQKKFISGAESEFKVPLTVISASAELIEKEHGPADETTAIRRQVRKMNGLLSKLSSLSVFDEEKSAKTQASLSELLKERLDRSDRLTARGIEVTQDIDDGVAFEGDVEAVKKAIDELIINASKFSTGKLDISLKKEGERVYLTFANDCDLPDGQCDQVFDRFTMLDNAKGIDGSGLGLSYVRDVVYANNGRASAKVENGRFIIRIAL